MSKDKDHIGPLDQPEMKQNIFEMPKGYFNGLEDQIRARMEAHGSDLENSEHLKQSVFEAPEGYFDRLENRIKARLSEESSLLSKEEKLKIPPFETPDGYFDQLESRVQERLTNEESETKVIPLYQRNWFRIAVAAVLIIGFFLLKPQPPIDNLDLSEDVMLAYLDESETDMELMASLDGFDTVIDQILEEETAGFDFDLEANPELDYEFEYFEQ